MQANHFSNVMFVTAVASLLLSLFAIYTDQVVGDDSLLYLVTAQQYLEGGMSAAIQTYSWPWMSVLIALMHQASGLPLTYCGYLLSIVSYMAIACIFVALVRELGGNSLVQKAAALIILCYPTLNDYRDEIIRDQGFWLFFLLSQLALIGYAREMGLRHVLLWLGAMAAATLFRVEGIAFLITAPLAILLLKDIALVRRLQMAGVLYLIAGSALLLALAIAGTLPFGESLRLAAELSRFPLALAGIEASLDSLAAALNAAVNNEHFAKRSHTLLSLGLVGVLVERLVICLTPVYLVLWLLGARRRDLAPRLSLHPVPLVYTLTGLAVLCYFLFLKLFMIDRYLVPVCLTLLLCLPFSVVRLGQQAPGYGSKYRWQPVLIGLLLGYQAMDSLVTGGASKAYVAEAAVWAKQHLSDADSVKTNSAHIAYFGLGRYQQTLFGERQDMKRDTVLLPADAEVLVLNIKNKDKGLRQAYEALAKRAEILQQFDNKRGDQVVVLRIRPPSTKPG